VVWIVRVTAKNEQGLQWLEANEFPLRKRFRKQHSLEQTDRNEGEHPHSLYVGPEVSSGGLFLDRDREVPPFVAKASAQTKRHCNRTLTDITEAIRRVGGTPANFDMTFVEDAGERIMG